MFSVHFLFWQVDNLLFVNCFMHCRHEWYVVWYDVFSCNLCNQNCDVSYINIVLHIKIRLQILCVFGVKCYNIATSVWHLHQSQDDAIHLQLLWAGCYKRLTFSSCALSMVFDHFAMRIGWWVSECPFLTCLGWFWYFLRIAVDTAWTLVSLICFIFSQAILMLVKYVL